MTKGMKKIAMILVVAASAFCLLKFVVPYIQGKMMKQALYDDAWAKEHGYDWHGNYGKDNTWAGSKHKKYHNLHENQLYDQKTGSMNKAPAIAGFRPQASLLSQPFADAFAHASAAYATPMPPGAEIQPEASPFAAVPEGHQPWTESELPLSKHKLYPGTPSRWGGQASSPDTKMFDTYDDNFDYDKSTGKITSSPVERIVDPAEYGDIKGARSGDAAKIMAGMTESEKAAMGGLAGVGMEIYDKHPWDESFVQ